MSLSFLVRRGITSACVYQSLPTASFLEFFSFFSQFWKIPVQRFWRVSWEVSKAVDRAGDIWWSYLNMIFNLYFNLIICKQPLLWSYRVHHTERYNQEKEDDRFVNYNVYDTSNKLFKKINGWLNYHGRLNEFHP